MTFGADDAALGALPAKEFGCVMMGTAEDGKVAVAKFGLVAQDHADECGKATDGEHAIRVLKQRRTVYPDHAGAAITKVRCFGRVPIIYFVRRFGNGSRPLAVQMRKKCMIGHFIIRQAVDADFSGWLARIQNRRKAICRRIKWPHGVGEQFG
ncbi:MAG: hypothetical protein F4Z86_14945 [Gemmatimonadetes bacterium]|nr:hypothetical protein [Gemmatimonadota bacterium]